MKIVFLGTPKIAVPSLEYFINKEDVDVQAVVTKIDKPAGRGKKLTPSPVKVTAEGAGINVYQPKIIRKDEELIATLNQLKPDFFITYAFGQILSQEVLDIPKYGTINLHVSLLPKYRGANPLQWCIINGEKETGVTTMLTTLGVDEGPILLTEKIKISEETTALDLAIKSANIGPELLYKSMCGLIDGSITPQEQDHTQATFAPKLEKEQGRIDWSKTAIEIHNKIRGFKPSPSIFAEFRENTIKIIETKLTDNKSEIIAGTIVAKNKNGIEVATGTTNILITQIQPPNKKAMDAASWCNGARVEVGEIFY